MTTAAGYFDRKPSSSIRPGLSHLQPDPSSPHTPQQRTFSSTFSSPSVSYRVEEAALVFEFGARHFSAGFTGESYPRCKLGFGPEESRRVGDYRKYVLGNEERAGKKGEMAEENWGEEHELWRMDLRGFDLGIVEDKIERAVRDAYTRFLLVDPKSRRLVVVVPSVIPHPLLNTLLGTLFGNFSMSSITLLSTPILCTVAAGCRSGLVIDIGWREATVTGIYEYREVLHRRTTRAMRTVNLEMAKLLQRHDKPQGLQALHGHEVDSEEAATLAVNLEQAEEVTTRMAWCQSMSARIDAASAHESGPEQPSHIAIAEDSPSDPPISLPSPSSPRQSIQIPFSQLAQPIESALLTSSRNLDDQEQPLQHLLYKTLLSLPPDVRAICMSRIMFTGGGANIPGLKARILAELSKIVRERGWDPVHGKAADVRREQLKEISSNRPYLASNTLKTIPEDDLASIPAHLASHDPDEIGDKLRHDQQKESKPMVSGVIRGVETLGAWAGASLLANLRIKGVVDIDRDSFLQHGLAGARKEAEMNVVPQKNLPRAGMGERGGGWTLGAWA